MGVCTQLGRDLLHSASVYLPKSNAVLDDAPHRTGNRPPSFPGALSDNFSMYALPANNVLTLPLQAEAFGGGRGGDVGQALQPFEHVA